MRDTSVYVHFPWCRKKCPYCDFVSYRMADEDIPGESYRDAVITEFFSRRAADMGFGNRRLVSIFIGGGTPSMWEPQHIGAVISTLRGEFTEVADDLEVTVECNPSSVNRARFEALALAGVNRVSIGVQSTRDEELTFLGRLHRGGEALQALRTATSVLPRVSGDLMFGMIGQTPEQFDESLDAVLDTGVRHVSAYALTIEPGTQFGELSRRGRTLAVEDDVYAEMFERGEKRAEAYGLAHYEVSNYASDGEESIHNRHYWRSRDYLGLGTGAVGCMTSAQGHKVRYRNEVRVERYLDLLSAEGARLGALEIETETLDAETMLREALLLGLRTVEGVSIAEVEHEAGRPLASGRERTLARQLELGNVVRADGRLRVPKDRWLHLDSITADLF